MRERWIWDPAGKRSRAHWYPPWTGRRRESSGAVVGVVGPGALVVSLADLVLRRDWTPRADATALPQRIGSCGGAPAPRTAMQSLPYRTTTVVLSAATDGGCLPHWVVEDPPWVVRKEDRCLPACLPTCLCEPKQWEAKREEMETTLCVECIPTGRRTPFGCVRRWL